MPILKKQVIYLHVYMCVQSSLFLQVLLLSIQHRPQQDDGNNLTLPLHAFTCQHLPGTAVFSDIWTTLRRNLKSNQTSFWVCAVTLQVHNPSWLHHQSYIMPPTVSIIVCVIYCSVRLQFSVLTSLCVVSTGNGPDTRDGTHHVHPAHLNDGTPDTAAQPPLYGQQRHRE